MIPTTQSPATLDDLYRIEGKAELIGGRIIHYPLGGFDPSRVAFEIAFWLRLYSVGEEGAGIAFAGGIGYALVPPLANGRQSFSPDALYYAGPRPANPMRFIEGPPTFAVEVRGEDDYGPAAEVNRQVKRADYFEAGTSVIWDVDLPAKMIVVYRGDPVTPDAVYRSGQVAEASPAVSGWRLAVDELFA